MRLSEVFVQGNKRPNDGDVVIAYKQWVWVLNDENYEDIALDAMLKLQITSDNQQFLDSPWELGNHVREAYPQAVVGTIDGFGDLVIQAENYRPSTDSSTLKKLMKALKIDEVVIDYFDEDFESDSTFREDRKQFVLPLKKKTFMHGTSYQAWASGINRTGIRPMGHKSNFDKIRHDDKIFLTLNKEKALFHADTARRNTDTCGLILELRLPDVDKLVTDYDVAIFNYGRDHKRTAELGYSDIDQHARNNFAGIAMSDAVNPDLRDIRNSGKDTLSSKLGIFGYIGRIPVKFIEGIWVDDASLVSSVFNEEFGSEETITATNSNNWNFYTVKQFNDRIADIYDEIQMEDPDYD